ncbi:MAG: PAS domain S-box protein [Acidobacteria bacterium]|nr:PAS domain S-box protein [Acidobacteriota bacterium]
MEASLHPLLSHVDIKDAHRPKEHLIAELEELRRRLAEFQTSEARDAWSCVETALRESEERYRELFENASDIVYTHDLSGRFTSVNKATERITGYTRAEALQMTIAELVAPEHLALAERMIDEEVRGSERTRYELEIITKSGHRVALELSTRLVYREGRPVGVQGIARDVTERRRVVEALRQQHEQQQTILDSVPGMMLSLGLDGRIVRANRAAARLFGSALENLERRSIDELHPRDAAAFVREGLDLVASGQVVASAVREIPAASGGRRWIQKDIAPYRDETGNIIGAIVFAVDITERKQVEEVARDNERHFRALFELAPIGIARLDLAGRILESNRALQEMWGYGPDDLAGRVMIEFTHNDDAPQAMQSLRDLVSGRRDRVQAEGRYFRKDGILIWADVTGTLVRDAMGQPQFVIATLENVSERKEAEEALRESNIRLTGWVTELEQRSREISLLSEMGDLLQACRSADEAHAVITRMARQLFPTESGSVSVIGTNVNLVECVALWGTPVGERLFPPDECWALRRGRVHVVQDAQLGLVCKHMPRATTSSYMCVPMMAQGEALGVLILTLPEGARLAEAKQRLAMTVAEHSALALANLKLHDTLRAQSIRDPLTGLFNRRYMEESLEREMRRAARGRHPVGIIMLDLDHFKPFNDSFGHEAGDTLLREVGSVLQRSIRGEDIACRYGGEEFTLILPEASLADAAQRAEHIREAIRGLNVQHRRQQLEPVTVSLGVAIYPDHGPTGDSVLRAADSALYQAKARGRDRVVVSPAGPSSRGAITDVG